MNIGSNNTFSKVKSLFYYYLVFQERRIAAIEHMSLMEEEMKRAQEQMRLRKEEQDREQLGSKR